MKNKILLSLFCLLFSLIAFGCLEENGETITKYEIPSFSHDLGYIPHDAKLDNPNYSICDSTKINSGRNRLQYIGGAKKLKEDVVSNYSFQPEYRSFSGYVVIRFLVNCNGDSGRYRAQSLNLDFSPLNAPSDLLENVLELIKSLDNWEKRSGINDQKEYSKYINLKIKNGEIEHVLL